MGSAGNNITLYGITLESITLYGFLILNNIYYLGNNDFSNLKSSFQVQDNTQNKNIVYSKLDNFKMSS